MLFEISQEIRFSGMIRYNIEYLTGSKKLICSSLVHRKGQAKKLKKIETKNKLTSIGCIKSLLFLWKPHGWF